MKSKSRPLLQLGRSPLIWSAVLAVFLQLPSLADVAKYESGRQYLGPLLIAGTFVGLLVVFWLLPRLGRLRAALSSPAVTVLLLLGIAAAAELLYRRELRRIAAGVGSTAAPAMSKTVEALLHGQGLYSVHLLGGAPVSPGPGWLLINAPFTWAHVYALMVPAWLALTAFVLRRSYASGLQVNIGLALLCCSPAFFRLLGEGHDIIALSCAVVLMIVWSDRWVDSDPSALLCGLAVGVLCTARIIYVPLALLYAVLLWTRSPRRGVIVGAVGVLVASGLFYVFSLGVHPYPPAHLFGRGHQRQPLGMLLVDVIVMLGIGVAVLRGVSRQAVSWFVGFAAIFSTAHLLIGLGELASSNYVLKTWEGANYVFAGAIPALVAVFALQSEEEATAVNTARSS